MIVPRQYFPWKVGRKVLVNQIAFLVILAITVGFSIRYFVYNLFSNTRDVTAAIGEFDHYLTQLFGFALLVGVLYQIWATLHFFRPLGKVLKRARELKRTGVVLSAEDLQEDIAGEWLDLERALGRIHGDLREQTDALSREREELTALIGAVSDAILAVDVHGEALFYNTQFAELFSGGLSSKKARLSETFRVPQVLQAFQLVLSNGETYELSTQLRTSRHTMPRIFNLSIAPLKSKSDGVVYGAVGIFHDVTELKQAEQIRIEFVGNASHELRTPLTSIKGYVETLRDDYAQGRLEGADKFLDIISRNVDRLIFLVNDLLDLSTIESGAELEKGPVSVREVTESVLKALDSRREQKHQQFETLIKIETIQADARRVEQVLTNLVHNAIKYIPDSKKIEVIWEDFSPSEIVLKVRDNGPGIPMEHLERLFERFYRIEGGRSRDQGGTGLGLSIVKHIMLKHGGRVSVKSKAGEGAEFICYFPK